MSMTLDRAAASPIERERRNYASLPEVLPLPNLIQTQIDSFKWFCDEGLGELFKEISPIQDFTGKNLDLRFLGSEFREPKYSEEECRTKDLTFSKPLYVNVELLIKETGEIQRQRVYMGDYPWMTDGSTVIPSLILIALATGTGGGSMLIFLAGLQGVPKELEEAAVVDGANSLQSVAISSSPAIAAAAPLAATTNERQVLPVPGGEGSPLSWFQERLWIHHRREPKQNERARIGEQK